MSPIRWEISGSEAVESQNMRARPGSGPKVKCSLFEPLEDLESLLGESVEAEYSRDEHGAPPDLNIKGPVLT